MGLFQRIAASILLFNRKQRVMSYLTPTLYYNMYSLNNCCFEAYLLCFTELRSSDGNSWGAGASSPPLGCWPISARTKTNSKMCLFPKIDRFLFCSKCLTLHFLQIKMSPRQRQSQGTWVKILSRGWKWCHDCPNSCFRQTPLPSSLFIDHCVARARFKIVNIKHFH